MAQTWDPERYARNARFVADLGAPVIELLGPKAGERILDLGCGDGVLTEKLRSMHCRVVGVDSSRQQVEAARQRGLEAHVADGERLGFDAEFDAVFSNAALHWMKDADAVIAGVRQALKPGGRFVGEMGGQGCIARIQGALCRELERRGVDLAGLDPWYFPGAEEYRGRLQAHGFAVDFIALIPRPTRLPGDIGGWLETFAESYVCAVPEGERTALVDAVREALRAELCGPDGVWTADYVRLRFAATIGMRDEGRGTRK
jgi:SAM-dependent methyltransferase